MWGWARGRKGKILLRGHGGEGLAVTECWAVTECELCTVHKLGRCWAVTERGGYRGLRRGYGGVEGGFFWVCGGFCPILREGSFLAFSGKVFKIFAGAFLGGWGKCVQNLGTALF